MKNITNCNEKPNNDPEKERAMITYGLQRSLFRLFPAPFLRRLAVVTAIFLIFSSIWLVPAGVFALSAGGQTARAASPASLTQQPLAGPDSPTLDGSFKVALILEPVTLAPANNWDWATFNVTSQVFDTLVFFQPGGSLPVPGLAQSWSVSVDGLTWTFNLRSGLKFQDGTNLDAEAVKFNFEWWWDQSHPNHTGDYPYFTAFFGGYKGDPASLITSVAVDGALKVIIVLREPLSSLPARLALPSFAIASPTAIQAGNLATQPVGSGPYRFVSRQPGSIHLEAFPGYWGEPPLFQDLYFQVIPSAADRLAALKAGQVDFADDFTDDLLQAALEDPNLFLAWRPSNSVGYLGINTGHPYLDKPLVRQAIAHALDIPLMVGDHFALGDQPAAQLLPPAVWGRDPGLSQRVSNPDLARSLLAQAGYPNGFSTNIYFRNVYRTYLPRPSIVVQEIAAKLAAVGIQAEIHMLESSNFISRVQDGTLDLFLLGWTADYPHPENFFSWTLCAGNLSFGPQDSQLCGLVGDAVQETDFSAQMDLYQQASRRVHETLPLIPLAHARSGVVMRRSFQPMRLSPLGIERLTLGSLAVPNLYLPLLIR
jgi:peptide/nickel transport system substrate-binding protein